MNNDLHILQDEAIQLLKELIATPSFSREEDKAASLIKSFLQSKGVEIFRDKNNVWANNKHFDGKKPTILLNSHLDTVRPNKGYTLNPFTPVEKKGKLYGLGSTDAGGCLVSLIATFLHYYHAANLKYNFILAATAEEEISGKDGVESLLPRLPAIDCAIVGEPTQLNLAIAERGLMVLNCIAYGKAGHAARNEGENAIYKAMKDIDWLKNFKFEKTSDLLGSVNLNVTSIETENKQHNVVPSECRFIVDVRVNELYSMEEVLETIKTNIQSEVKTGSTRLRSTCINIDHPLVQAGIKLSKTYYGSPTTSDKALMNFPALKMGPGDSARSHTADEFIYINEIKQGIETYIQLLNHVVL